jgi:hypothetical protein
MGIPYFSNIPSNGCIYCCFFNDVIAGWPQAYKAKGIDITGPWGSLGASDQCLQVKCKRGMSPSWRFGGGIVSLGWPAEDLTLQGGSASPNLGSPHRRCASAWRSWHGNLFRKYFASATTIKVSRTSTQIST